MMNGSNDEEPGFIIIREWVAEDAKKLYKPADCTKTEDVPPIHESVVVSTTGDADGRLIAMYAAKRSGKFGKKYALCCINRLQ